MLCPSPEVAVDRLRRPVPEGRGADTPTLPEDADHPRVKIEVRAIVALEPKAGELGESDAGVSKPADDRGVAPILEIVARCTLEDRLDIDGRWHRDGLLGGASEPSVMPGSPLHL
jgi:hypothetical protein